MKAVITYEMYDETQGYNTIATLESSLAVSKMFGDQNIADNIFDIAAFDDTYVIGSKVKPIHTNLFSSVQPSKGAVQTLDIVFANVEEIWASDSEEDLTIEIFTTYKVSVSSSAVLSGTKSGVTLTGPGTLSSETSTSVLTGDTSLCTKMTIVISYTSGYRAEWQGPGDITYSVTKVTWEYANGPQPGKYVYDFFFRLKDGDSETMSFMANTYTIDNKGLVSGTSKTTYEDLNFYRLFWSEGTGEARDGSTIPAMFRVYGYIYPSEPTKMVIFINNAKPFAKTDGNDHEVQCGSNLVGAFCYFYGSDDSVGWDDAPYPELFDRIEIDVSQTPVS